MKTCACRDGTLKTRQTRWERHHNIFIPSLHLVPFCQLCTTQNCTLNKQTSHPLLLTHHPSCIQDACLPHSATIQYHYITYTLTCHTDSALLVHSTASAYKTDHIYHAHAAAIALQQPTMQLTLHAHHALHTHEQ